MIVIVW